MVGGRFKLKINSISRSTPYAVIFTNSPLFPTLHSSRHIHSPLYPLFSFISPTFYSTFTFTLPNSQPIKSNQNLPLTHHHTLITHPKSYLFLLLPPSHHSPLINPHIHPPPINQFLIPYILRNPSQQISLHSPNCNQTTHVTFHILPL